ncbi:HAD family acid phosphatase [Streptomyces sp. NPDC088350]|uniref:HAD family acid phosphatase n=1 Tax=Streptomyces sp. NPDC088350 TaxID=3365854 RepID=UPI0038045B6B
MTTGTWTRRTGITVIAVTAIAAMTVPANARAVTATSTSSVATATEDVDYATWQADCQTVMNQALPYLKKRIASTEPGEKQAIVFDIDNTTLETDFGFSWPQPANKPVLAVAKYAQEHGVSLFFVTARLGIIYLPTEYNLEVAGYDVSGLRVRNLFDLFKDVAAYKTAQRANIESKGYTIIANIGNSATDLSGGHSEKTYKLPDYDGQLS